MDNQRRQHEHLSDEGGAGINQVLEDEQDDALCCAQKARTEGWASLVADSQALPTLANSARRAILENAVLVRRSRACG